MKRFASLLVAFLVCLIAGRASSADQFAREMETGLPLSGGTLTGNLQIDCASCPYQIYQTAPLSDAAPDAILVHAADSYPQATGANLVGGGLYLRGGMGSRYLTVTDYTKSTSDTVTVSVQTPAGAVSTVLTAGTGFTCTTSNNACATSLASAIDALAGVGAYAVGAIVYLTADATTLRLDTPVADGGVDGPFATLTGSASVGTVIGNGSGAVSNPQLSFASGTGLFKIAAVGSFLYFTPTTVWSWAIGNTLAAGNSSSNIVMAGGYVYDSTTFLKFNGAATTSHSLSTGASVFNGAVEVNGALYADAGLAVVGIEEDLTAGACTAGALKVDTGGGSRENCRCNSGGTAYDCCTIAAAPTCSTNGPVD